jgi:ABC-type sugar transport system ATPase subunit
MANQPSCGWKEISGGTIAIGGKVINEVEPKHRDIAMVFQNYALYPHMTVADNIGFRCACWATARPSVVQQ